MTRVQGFLVILLLVLLLVATYVIGLIGIVQRNQIDYDLRHPATTTTTEVRTVTTEADVVRAAAHLLAEERRAPPTVTAHAALLGTVRACLTAPHVCSVRCAAGASHFVGWYATCPQCLDDDGHSIDGHYYPDRVQAEQVAYQHQRAFA